MPTEESRNPHSSERIQSSSTETFTALKRIQRTSQLYRDLYSSAKESSETFQLYKEFGADPLKSSAL